MSVCIVLQSLGSLSIIDIFAGGLRPATFSLPRLGPKGVYL